MWHTVAVLLVVNSCCMVVLSEEEMRVVVLTMYAVASSGMPANALTIPAKPDEAPICTQRQAHSHTHGRSE